jgi:hypothetical protein
MQKAATVLTTLEHTFLSVYRTGVSRHHDHGNLIREHAQKVIGKSVDAPLYRYTTFVEYRRLAAG